MAGLDRLVYRTVDSECVKVLDDVRVRVEKVLSDAGSVETAEFLNRVTAMGFVWGVSDGN